MTDTRTVDCFHCNGSGRNEGGHPNDPNPPDYGPCRACDGTGTIEVPTEPVTLEDLDDEP